MERSVGPEMDLSSESPYDASMRVLGTFVVGVVLFALASAGAATGGRAATVVCAAWAAPTGNDAAAGTNASPFKTIAKLQSVLAPGSTGCLRSGAVFPEHVVIGARGLPAKPVVLTTPSGPPATIGDGVEFLQSSHFVTLSRVVVTMSGLEPANSLPAVVAIGGFQNKLVRSDVSGGGVVDKSRDCVRIDHGNLIVVDGNRIHACGIRRANQAVYAPGIRVATGSNATIINNVVTGTPGDGIALFPNAKDSVVSHNIIDGTATGVFFGADATFVPRGNKVTDNIISFISGKGIHGANYHGTTYGVGNIASRNCLWRITGIGVGGPGFTGSKNRVVDPKYANRPASYALRRSSPCWENRPRP